MKKLILMLLYSLSSYGDVDLEITFNGETHKVSGVKTPYINIGSVTCGITNAKGQIIGSNHEPGESVKIECPGFLAITKTCRTPWGTEYGKAWAAGWNSEPKEIYVNVDNIPTHIKMVCAN